MPKNILALPITTTTTADSWLYMARDGTDQRINTDKFIAAVASQAEMEAGAETELRRMSPWLVAKAILALSGAPAPFYVTLTAGENLSGGNMLWFSGTEIFKADASAGRPAFAFTITAVTIGNPVNCVFGGLSSGLSGLTPGSSYFLSTIAGGFTTIAPSGGNIVQRVGTAVSATSLAVEIGQPLTTV